MSGRIKKVALVMAALTVSMIILACDLEEALGLEGKSSEDEKPNSLRFSFSGTGSDTWGWGPDAYTCDTQDNMTLTISYANTAVLTAKGACFWTSSAYETCTQRQSSLPCGLVVYGTFSAQDQRVSFDSCNTQGLGNGKGSGNLVFESDSSSRLDITGQAFCSFSNTDETHELKFNLAPAP